VSPSSPSESTLTAALRPELAVARLRVCYLIESGTDVRVVEGLAARFDLTLVARRILGGVEISHLPDCEFKFVLGPSPRSRFAFFAAKFLRKHRSQFDYILVQGYGLAALAANLMSMMTAIPTAMVICSPVEAYYLCRKSNPQAGKRYRIWELRLFKAIARLNAKMARRYLVLSDHLADIVRAHGTEAPVDVVPIYGVDLSLFQPRSRSQSALKHERGLPASGQVIFFSSRIAPEKDSDTMLASLRILLDRGRDLWLLHRSGGYEAFRREAERIGVAHRLIATNAVHPHRELPMDYQASDICVQASREEGLGFSPIEAMACRVPVVASAVGGLKETVVHGCTGWSYPVGDAYALAKCIEEILDVPAEAERRCDEAIRMVHNRYDHRDAFNRLETVIAEDCMESAGRIRDKLSSIRQ
jgi:glycosyltransferase involved in cell wall biosynthesis